MTGTAVVLLLVLMKPVLLLTAIETEAVPPGEIWKVEALVEMENVSVVLVTVRVTLVETFDGLTGVMVTFALAGSMVGRVEMVSVVVGEFAPVKFTLVGLKLQLAPVGRPAQLLGLKLITAGLEPLMGVIVKTTEADAPAATVTD